MEIYKRIILQIIFNYFLICSIVAGDTIMSKKNGYFLSCGLSYFNINDKKDRKYYSGEYGGGYISGGYERKYFITELKYQYGKSKDATYHFGEWNFGAKIDFSKFNRISLMTGLYAYCSENPIGITIKDLPFFDITTDPYYGTQLISLAYRRDTAFSFYQGSSNFMQMDISNGKFKFVGTNLMTMILMHLKLEYNARINQNLSLSLSGSTYFSNAIDEFISLHNFSYINEKYFSKKISHSKNNPKYILNECSSPPVFYDKTKRRSVFSRYTFDPYYVPRNILFNINIGLCYKF
jgi:hypothetical protein